MLETLTDVEATKFLGLKTRITLYRWRKAGIGPRFMRYGNKLIRYRLRDLVAWQKSQLVAPPRRNARR